MNAAQTKVKEEPMAEITETVEAKAEEAETIESEAEKSNAEKAKTVEVEAGEVEVSKKSDIIKNESQKVFPNQGEFIDSIDHLLPKEPVFKTLEEKIQWVRNCVS